MIRSLITLKALTYAAHRRASSPHPPPRCPRTSAGCATGTTGTAGCGTPRSRWRRCCGPATPRRPTGLAGVARPGGGRRPGGRADHVRGGRRAQAGRMGGRLAARVRAARRRSGSATRRWTSASSTCTARSSTRSRSAARPASPSTGTPGACSGSCSDFLEKHWDEPDEGIWEVRGPRRHFVHSKVMAWVAFDRARSTVASRAGRAARTAGGRSGTRSTPQVCEQGYDTERGAFTQYYGSAELDASVLLIPEVGFLPPDDPRVVSTVETIKRELMHRRPGAPLPAGRRRSDGRAAARMACPAARARSWPAASGWSTRCT